MVAFKTDGFARTGDRKNGTPVIVPLPVGIGNIVTITAAPGLGGIDAGTKCDAVSRGNNQRIGAAKGTI